MEKIKVLVVKPNKNPYILEIDNGLKALQEMVDGYIESVTLSPTAVLICNEEGRLAGLQRNRSVDGYSIVGTFMIMGFQEDEFASISDIDAEKYTKQLMIRDVNNCRIYQIDPLDEDFVFRGIDAVHEKGLQAPPASLYKVVFDGQLGTDDPEDIFRIFNLDHPAGYSGRSLSMSDIVETYGEEGSRFFYCDTTGFEEIPFQP